MKDLFELLNKKFLSTDRDCLRTDGSFFITIETATECLEYLKNYLDEYSEETYLSPLEKVAITLLIDMLGVSDEILKL